MTGLQLLDNSLALLLMDSAQAPEYSEFAAQIINIMLAETADYNDCIRESKGLSPANGMLRVESLAEELPCEPELCAAALAFGMCSKLLVDDSDMPRVAYFANQYLAACESAAKCTAHPVRDVYLGDER